MITGVHQTPLDRNEITATPITSTSKNQYEYDQAMLPVTIVGNDSVFDRPYSSNESPIFNINMSPKSRGNSNRFDIMVIEQKKPMYKKEEDAENTNEVSYIPP